MSTSIDQSASHKPHFSTILKTASPFGKKEPHIEFGKKWKELVLPVAAFRIKLLDGGISSIKNVVADDIPRLMMLDQFSATERTHIFQLIEGEQITKIEANVGSECIHAVRFHTTMRVSLWYGSARGQVHEIAAPDGFIIRSLYGAWGRLLREVGAVFVPLQATKLPIPAEPVVCEVDCLEDIDTVVGDYRAPFSVSTLDLGAVVVGVSSSIKWIRVLSREQVQQLMDLQNGIYTGDSEQWLALIKGEQVIRIDFLVVEEGIHDEDLVVEGLRFTTTLRTMPWIGSAPSEDYDEDLYECEEGSHICGFHGARGRNGIVQLGCFVTSNASEKLQWNSMQESESGSPEVEKTTVVEVEREEEEDERADSEEEEPWDVLDTPSSTPTEDLLVDVHA